MIWHALLIFSIIATVARVRQRGVSWLDIFGAISQWFHFIIFGGEWLHTMCSCIGLHTRDGKSNQWLWTSLEVFFDIVFFWREPNHCATSLRRVEKEKA